MAVKRHTTPILKSNVRYWEYGPKKATTVVAIHGFRGTHHGLEKVAGELADFHLIIPDLPGFGESDPFLGKKHDLNQYVAFVKEFIDSLKLDEPSVLLGHSFGSIVCAHFAAKYPKAINKLVLINPISAPALEGPRGIMTRLAIAYYWLGRKLPKSMSAKWLSAKPIVKIMSVTMAKSKDKDMLAFIHNQHLQHFSTFANSDVVAEAFHTSVSNDVSSVASELNVPTLLIAGELDDITTVDKQRKLQEKTTSAHLEVIDGVGHLIHYEKPWEAATLIRAFLRQ